MAIPPRRPAAFRLDDVEAADGGQAFVSADGYRISETAEPLADSLPAVAAAGEREPGSLLGRMFWTAAGGLAGLAVSLGIAALIDELFARAQWLGWAGVALLAMLVLSLALIAWREFSAVLRLERIDQMRAEAIAILATDDRETARALVKNLGRVYANVPRLAAARAELDRARHEIVDGADLVRLAERQLMADLDARARRLVGEAATRVSAVTAIAPRAVIDVAVVVAVTTRLIRGIAEIYAGRPGRLGFLRLLRHVVSHLAVTGGMAAGEGVIDQLVGHGIAARLSARLGEGMINGLLTARVGLAAIAVCRPLPFVELPQPTVRDVAGSLFEGRKGASRSALEDLG